MSERELKYGQCARCGGSLTAWHKCPAEGGQPDTHRFDGPAIGVTRSRFRDAIDLYVTVNKIQQKTLAKEWRCSESTVCRFLGADGKWPDAETTLRIIAWMMD